MRIAISPSRADLLFLPILLIPLHPLLNHFKLLIINNQDQKRNTTMIKKLGVVLLMLALNVAPATAESMDFALTAGSSSLAGSINFRKPLYSGYMKTGIAGVYSDDDTTEYQWGSVQLLVGSDTIAPGIWGEVGLKGIFGSAEEREYSGDIAVVAFTGSIGYIFPSSLVRIPIELSGGLSYAPDPLAFMDTSTYSEFTIGVGIHIVPQASIEVSYHVYGIEFDEGPGQWDLDDNAVRFGVTMRF